MPFQVCKQTIYHLIGACPTHVSTVASASRTLASSTVNVMELGTPGQCATLHSTSSPVSTTSMHIQSQGKQIKESTWNGYGFTLLTVPPFKTGNTIDEVL